MGEIRPIDSGSVVPVPSTEVHRATDSKVHEVATRTIDRQLASSWHPLKWLRKKILHLGKEFFFPALQEKKDGGEAYAGQIRANKDSLFGLEHTNQTCCVEMTIPMEQGGSIDAMLMRPLHPTHPEKIVIFAPGNDRSVFHQDYQYVFHAYLSRGISVMAFDYRGVGLSEGQLSTTGTSKDIEAVYQKLKEETRASDQDIMVEGYSFGSCPALSLAAHHPELKVFLRCPMSSPQDAAEGLLEKEGCPRFTFALGRIATRFAMPSDNEKWIRQVQHENLHIVYSNDHLERTIHSTTKLLSALLNHEPTEEEKKQLSSYSGVPNHAEHYFDVPSSTHPLTQAFDTFLTRIGFSR